MNRRVLYIQFTDPAGYPPLQHSARLLADRGFQVLFLGIGYSETRTLRVPAHPNITVKLCAARLNHQSLAVYYLKYLIRVGWWIMRWRPGWLYASDTLATPSAWLASYLPFLRVLYHEHDTPTTARGLTRWALKTRAWLIARAAVCVVPSAGRAEQLAREFGIGAKTYCVWNCPERAEVQARPPISPVPPAAPFRLLYHGSVVPSRLPLMVIDALALLPAHVHLRVAGYETVGHPGYVEQLLERARALGVAPRVEWLGQVPTRTELLAQARECDVGLALMPMQSDDVNERTMAGASNKPFDYMACGLGIVVSDLEDWRAIFVRNEFARACDAGDPASIAAAVCAYLDRRDERVRYGTRARDQILQDWNYETCFAPVLTVMLKEKLE